MDEVSGVALPVVDLSDFWDEDAEGVLLGGVDSVVVYIPLPSIGYSNSHIDICEDLIEASWTAEQLATAAEAVDVEHDYPPGTHKVRLKLTFRRPGSDFLPRLLECAVLFRDLDESDPEQEAHFRRTRDAVVGYQDQLEELAPLAPDIVDWYYANLVGGAYAQMRYDAPDYYKDEITRFPERRTGFYKSGFSHMLGRSCYASPDSWLVPSGVPLDRFFAATGQKYEPETFLSGEVLLVAGNSYVVADGLVAYFPMNQYFKSRVCASLVREKEEDPYDTETYDPDNFDWTDASFTHSPYLEHLWRRVHDQQGHRPGARAGILIDSSGTLVTVFDGLFTHVLYDTKTLNIVALKELHEEVGKIAGQLSSAIGLPGTSRLYWQELTDESFEQLCYDVIYAHPRFDSDTIRKLGKSRSRDGGRDIEAFDLPVRSADRPRKWIFQCKLVTDGSSLTGRKLVDVGDMLEHYSAEGFSVMTSALIDATLYDKLDAVCGKRGVEQLHFSAMELERAVSRSTAIRDRYFPSDRRSAS